MVERFRCRLALRVAGATMVVTSACTTSKPHDTAGFLGLEPVKVLISSPQNCSSVRVGEPQLAIVHVTGLAPAEPVTVFAATAALKDDSLYEAQFSSTFMGGDEFDIPFLLRDPDQVWFSVSAGRGGTVERVVPESDTGSAPAEASDSGYGCP